MNAAWIILTVHVIAVLASLYLTRTGVIENYSINKVLAFIIAFVFSFIFFPAPYITFMIVFEERATSESPSLLLCSGLLKYLNDGGNILGYINNQRHENCPIELEIKI